MEERFKICPGCGGEFFAHVVECASCGLKLIYPEQRGRPGAQRASSAGQLVCIGEGDLARVTDISGILRKEGFEHQVLKRSALGCSAPFGIYVAESSARAAARAVEEGLERLYPGLREAEERLDEGLCPACGAMTAGAPECPDCGLNLSGGEGCGGGGCSDSCH